jgi:hypothetical protein
MPSSDRTDDQREQQISRLLKAYEKRLREKYPPGVQTIDEVERTAQEIGEGVKQDIQQEKADAAGTGYAGRTLDCSCGGRSGYKDCHERRLVTLHGELILRRAYYWCSSCRRGTHPVDALLGMPRGQESVSVRALACRFTSVLPYEQAARELELVCGVRLSVSTLQRISRAAGQELAKEWAARQDQVWSGDYEPQVKAPQQMHVSMDGVMANVGKWREVKLAVCFQRGKDGPTHGRYFASLAPSHEFGKQVKTLSVFAGASLCRNVAVLADGSDWIWQEAAKHFTCETHILDFFHVSQHLWAVANAWFGPNAAQASAWIGEQKERLLEHDIGASEVIQAVVAWAPQDDPGRHLRRKTIAYLVTHQHRMRYKLFRSQGYHIGSGVMESSCRWVVQQRMKSSGMRWSEKGATAMLALRTAYCSQADEDIVQAVRRTASPA